MHPHALQLFQSPSTGPLPAPKAPATAPFPGFATTTTQFEVLAPDLDSPQPLEHPTHPLGSFPNTILIICFPA